MNEIVGNIWDSDVDAICITTNGTVMSNGRNIMGGGIALEAKQRVPDIDLDHGTAIKQFGHRFQNIGYWTRPIDNKDISLWAFPSKRTIGENSDLDTIENSLVSLVSVAHAMPLIKFGLPRPGSSLGGLDWFKDVKELVEEYLTDDYPNITVYHYNQVGAPIRG